jgi:hypothetical protein
MIQIDITQVRVTKEGERCVRVKAKGKRGTEEWRYERNVSPLNFEGFFSH